MSTVRARSMLVIATLTGLALASMAVVALLFVRSRLDSDLDAHLKAVAFSASRLIDVSRPLVLTYMEQGLGLVPGEGFLLIYDSDGRRVAGSSGFDGDLGLSVTARDVSPGRYDAVVETGSLTSGRRVRVATFARTDFVSGSKDVRFYSQAGVMLDRHDAQIRRLAFALGGLAVVTWMLLLLAVGSMAHRWFDSLRHFSHAAGLMSQSRLWRQRLPVDRRDAEMRGMAEAINRLLDDVEAANARQQQFVADASHELRTPLTVLRGEIEVALRRPRSAEDYRDVLTSSGEEIDKLSRLTDNLLVLARADAGQLASHREPVDLPALARSVIARLGAAAAEKKLALRLDAMPAVTVQGDAASLERALSNLLENAIAYCPAGEEISVACVTDGAMAELRVSDTGPGIPPEHAARIFDRFYRVSRSRSREGAGLGLAIVKAIAEAHGGRVTLASRSGHGCVFTLELPVMDTPDGKSAAELPG